MVLLALSTVLVGCEASRSLVIEKKRLSLEQELLLRETNRIQEAYKGLNDQHTEFISQLIDDQLKTYDKFITALNTGNQAKIEINERELQNVLSAEKWEILTALMDEYVKLGNQANSIVERAKLFNRDMQEYREQQQARQAAGRTFGQAIQQASQDYYNRQMETYKDYNQRSMMQFDLQESQRRQTNRLLNAMRGY